MLICRVSGEVIATVKNSHFTGKKILLVQPLNIAGQAEGEPFLAVDTVDAGRDDRVLVLREGGSARIVFNDNDIPLQAVIVAVVDQLDIPDPADARI